MQVWFQKVVVFEVLKKVTNREPGVQRIDEMRSLRLPYTLTVALVLGTEALHGVEGVWAVGPWKGASGKSTVEEEDSVSHNHSVVEVDDGGDKSHAMTQASQGRGQPTVDLDGTQADVLSQGQLHEEGRNCHHKLFKSN